MKQRKKSAGYQGYIPVYLNEQDKQRIAASPLGLGQAILLIEEFVEDGYKFTLSWDEYNDCLAASLYDTDVKRPTAGYILSGKHRDLETALNIICYLHKTVYPDGWDIERVNRHDDTSWEMANI